MFAAGGLETLSEPARGHAGERGQDAHESERVACELKLDIEMSDIADSIDVFTDVLRFNLALSAALTKPRLRRSRDVSVFVSDMSHTASYVHRRPQV